MLLFFKHAALRDRNAEGERSKSECCVLADVDRFVQLHRFTDKYFYYLSYFIHLEFLYILLTSDGNKQSYLMKCFPE